MKNVLRLLRFSALLCLLASPSLRGETPSGSSAQAPQAVTYFEAGQGLAKSGNAAEATLNFRRALLLDPALLPARTALRENELALGIQPPRETWRTTVASQLPMDASAVGGAILFWLGILVGILACFATRPRRSHILAAMGLAVVGLGLMALVWITDPRVLSKDNAVLLKSGGASLLREPADSSEKITSLSQGSLIRILSIRGRWLFAETPTGTKGWLLAEGVEPVVPTS